MKRSRKREISHVNTGVEEETVRSVGEGRKDTVEIFGVSVGENVERHRTCKQKTRTSAVREPHESTNNLDSLYLAS